MYIRIGNLRIAYEYPVDYVCKEIGCSRPQLYNLENGRYNPLNVKYQFIAGIADLYGISCDDVVHMMSEDHVDYENSCASDTVSEDQCSLFV